MRIYRRLLPYCLAIGSTAIALLLSLWLELVLSQPIGALFYIAVIVSTWYGGFKPGIVTIILSTLAIDYFLIYPRYQIAIPQPEDLLRIGLFLLVALTINLITTNFYHSRQKIVQLSQKLAQENAEQLRMALAAARMGMWDWDIAAAKIKLSPEHEELFGFRVGSFDGKQETFIACLHPDDRALIHRTIEQALQTHSPFHCEFRAVWADGSIHWLEGRGDVFSNTVGEPVRMVGTVMAIDERKQAQITLQQQFEQQRLVMDITQRIRRSLNLADILQTTVDEVRQFLECDRVIIFQLQPNGSGTVVVESVTANLRAILSTNISDPCFSEKYIEPFQQGLVTAKSDIYTANIDACHVELLANFQVRANLAVPILNQDKLWGLLIAHHCEAPREWQSCEIELLRQLASQVSIAIQQADLLANLQTELAQRQQIEAALRQSEHRYRALVHASSQIIWHTNAEGMTIVVPNGWEEFTGQTPEECLGFGWLNCIHPDDRDRVAQRWQESYTHGTLYETEYRLRMKDGNYRDFAIRGVPIFAANGKISEWIGANTDITERKQAEIALQESQIQLQQQLAEIETIYQSAPIGLNVLDTDLRFVRINQRLAEINGSSVEAHIGRTVRELLPNLADTTEQLLHSVLATGEPLLNVEVTGKTPAQPGVQRTWLESFLPLKDGDASGNPCGERIIGISTVCEEITERKQIEAELKQAKEELEIRVAERTAELIESNADLQRSESTLRSFFNSSSMLMGIVELYDRDILHISDNQTTARFFGTSPEAMENKFASDLGVPQETIDKWLGYYRQSAQIQAPVRFEYPHDTANGQRWLAATVSPITFNHKGYPRFSYIVEDISDAYKQAAQRKRIEDALRESEEKFRQLAENIQAVFWMRDMQTQEVLYVSKTYETIWQRSCESAYQNLSNWLDSIHLEDRPRVQSTFVEQLIPGQSDIKYRIIRPDGSMRWIRDRAFPIKNELGEVIRVAGIAEDITELEKVEQMKSEFIGIVSHELRTPLTAIRASLGLLNTGIYDNRPEKFKRMIEIAAIDCDRLVRLVNDILDLERLDSGRAVLQKTPCKAADLIQQAVEGVKAIATQQNITFNIYATDVQVWAAADTIIQTLTNLLSNALKFSPDDSTIDVSVQQQSDRVLFQISDRGRGIPPEKLELIFGRFQQVDASDSRDKGGTGLGLAICRSIVEQHGGKIWAQSTLGVGSTFCFTLPLSLK
ncbi:PAS domain-containing protein [Tolypothrix sp. FACHB-123]|uniref:PAS domain-containing protein n=1 Tax=Tolypothrix sp. FACHB-123 TaxID=2692868 RepID=UPI0016871A84|nr:PAS domain-containing protein [Tolypothrix sp. FACHB-123]MBD2354938.1 PAS domain-containing protein [Tolypothrix sp. FACHB-123]